MADDKSNPAGPFFDAFRNFGTNLRLPTVTVDDMMAHHRANIAAMEKAARNTTEGTKAVMAEQRKALEATLADITKMVETAREGGMNRETARELLAEQVAFTQRSFERTLETAGAVGSAMRDTTSDNMAVLRERVQQGIEEMKTTMDRNDGDEPPVKES
ncbi:TIGR01841 family phasin [Ahrensia sp. R2A130]|uniref:TIGR01841 family phasin n=1 Tax=Ahrensia sp. R2A130 TaxID=744979 RepID=UPI0001E0D13E|nr:TIGR01841 family phasin [Ahrensia sp. R2A130]EFL87663.1 phasin family protein [Ahrensia sp. R2A130]